jgi:uncharacterized membrane protein YccC
MNNPNSNDSGNPNTAGGEKKKKPASVLVCQIISGTAGVMAIGFIIAIFTGVLPSPTPQIDPIEVGRVGGIIGTVVSVGVAVLFAALARKNAAAAK